MDDGEYRIIEDEEYTIIDDEDDVPRVYLILYRNAILNTKKYASLIQAYKDKKRCK